MPNFGEANCPRHATQPKISLRQGYGRQANAKFWRNKIATNKARDQPSPMLRPTGLCVNRLLRAKGWTVLRIWEHELLRRDEPKLLRRLTSVL